MKFKNFMNDLLASSTDRMFEEAADEIIREMKEMEADPNYEKIKVLKEINSVGLEEMIDFIGVEKVENIIRKKKLKKLLNG